MVYDPGKHHRRSIRLKGYDYAQAGVYFVTVCTQGKVCLFGDVADKEMRLNDAGRMVRDTWEWLAVQYDYVELDEYVVMPNHFHGILVIADDGRGGSRTAPTAMGRKPLGRLIGAFKTVCTKHINKTCGFPGMRIWQRDYYEHIIRSDGSLNRIRQYIMNNPEQWEWDRENPIDGQPRGVAPIGDEPWRV